MITVACLAQGLTACPADGEPELQHGVVKIGFKRGLAESESPYSGTATIEVTLSYEKCLADFYVANPEYRITGPEGDKVFGDLTRGGEGWKDRLCDGGSIECSVLSFNQELDDAKFLTVSYEASGEIEDREILWGPIPKASLAACEAGSAPTVRVASNSVARGLDGGGNIIWETDAFSPSTAAVDQGASIDIRAVRPD